ncbi:homeobox-containing protein 1-like isoform X2 [Syngnathoides biaculeatus]|uniref:homeobox-containing protein 1-like isoform X2 n=1 Tax=Syngnathoides biaculeatus TaxID=300417 RepID=UPI002ADE765C|nr:homeobox-containing protein 1-like isoform X2 [Syngnathoides biaculeatus]
MLQVTSVEDCLVGQERMFQQCEEPRFTIEQIDLLQRLRRTGIGQAELLHALDTLDHLDHLERPRRLTSNHQASFYAPPSSSTAATQTVFSDSRLSPSSFDVTLPVDIATVAQTNGKMSPLPRFPLVGGSVLGYGFETGDEDVDVDEKVEDLMRRDSGVVKEEIKCFLANRRISQAVVAQVTGISQSRISHWLLQQGSDLSEQKKRAFFRWYQLEKSSPGATLALRNAPLALEDVVMDWQQAPSTFAPTPVGFRLRRGNRFTWRKECLAVMESYFSDNQYPDEARREEISMACNAVIQKPGRQLLDFEKVTSLKVYNWFANRRKDIKRRANIAAILESHSIDVESPGGQSNSDEVDATDFTEQVSSLPPNWMAALGRGGASGARGCSLTGRAPPPGRRASWSPPSPEANMEKMAEHQADGAGLTLAGDIKTEVIEDD